jgi:hypothetical protein
MIFGSAYNTTYILFSFAKRKGKKSQFHSGAVCNAQKSLYGYSIFSVFFFYPASFCEIETISSG